MSEPATGNEPAPPMTAGALLRAARQKQGLHLAALAAAIKVTPRKLEALEGDRYGELPDVTFARALALTVCRALKVDAEPVLALLPKAGAAARLDQAGPGLNTPFRDRMDGHRDGRDLGWLKGPMAWATGLILLGAAAVELLPTQLWSGLFDSTTSGSVPVVLPSTSATFPIASAPVDPAASAVPPEVAAPTLVETVHSAPAATAASGPAAAVDAARLLVVRTSAESWIDVRDAGGQMLLSRVVQAGETVSLDGQIPLRLTVGNASATELSFRGQTIDLAAVSRDNVARLELK